MADHTSNPQAGAAQGAAPPTPAQALATAGQVEQLADRLSACADAMHERVMRDIHRYPGEVPESEKTAARALLDAEQALRQRADRLYQDAAACIVGALGQTQQHVIQLTTDAAAKIQTMARIGDAVGLAARLVNLAGAVIFHEGFALVAALDALQAQLAAAAAHSPAPMPAEPSSAADPPSPSPAA